MSKLAGLNVKENGQENGKAGVAPEIALNVPWFRAILTSVTGYFADRDPDQVPPELSSLQYASLGKFGGVVFEFNKEMNVLKVTGLSTHPAYLPLEGPTTNHQIGYLNHRRAIVADPDSLAWNDGLRCWALRTLEEYDGRIPGDSYSPSTTYVYSCEIYPQGQLKIIKDRERL